MKHKYTYHDKIEFIIPLPTYSLIEQATYIFFPSQIPMMTYFKTLECIPELILLFLEKDSWM